MLNHYDFVIAGASRAGLAAAQVLRDRLPESTILILNGEDRQPYKRTSLSKHLAEGFGREEFALFPAGWYEEHRLDLLNSRLTALRPDGKEAVLSTGGTVGWDRLLLAVGASPAVLDIPGAEWTRQLRTARDAELIREELGRSARVIVIGQGVEGVELAEQCRLAGTDVVVTGMDSRLMQRWLDPELSGRLLRLLAGSGVECRFDSPALRIEREGDGLCLHTPAEVLEGDLILSSTGIRPNTGAVQSLGITGPGGIRTDRFLETAIPGVFAAGDVVDLPDGYCRGLWHSAEYQGETAALNMAGIPSPLDKRFFRLKCEVFGDFFFSMGLAGVQESDHMDLPDMKGDGYLKLFSREGRTVAALMAGFKDSAKMLAEQVARGMPPEDVIGLF